MRKVELRDEVLLASTAFNAGVSNEVEASKDKRSVFVVDRFDGQVQGSTSRRLIHGGNAQTVKAVVVFVNVCSTTLRADVTTDRLQSAVFSNSANSFKSVLSECSHNGMGAEGSVMGPYDICPSSTDLWGLYAAVEAYMMSNHRSTWDGAFYKIKVFPAASIPAVGVGTVGGGLTWYGDAYVAFPQLFLHEVGHNWRLHHAATAFQGDEYGDTSCAMGWCCSTRCYNFIHNWQLGFAEYLSKLTLSGILADSDSSTGFTAVQLPAQGVERNSGVKIVTSSSGSATDAFLVMSYRHIDTGFDRHLSAQSKYSNSVQVHHWDGDQTNSAELSFMLHNIKVGETVLIKDTDRQNSRLDTDLKVSFVAISGSTASVRLCRRLSTDTAASAAMCGPTTSLPPSTTTTTPVMTVTFTATSSITSTKTMSSTSTATMTTTTTTPVMPVTFTATSSIASTKTMTSTSTATMTTTSTTTTPLNPGGPWTGYFDSEASSNTVKDNAKGALIGFGCTGNFCSRIKTNFRSDVEVSDQGITVQQADTGNGDMMCNDGQVATAVTCLGDNCDALRLHCAWPKNGRIQSQPHERSFIPSDLHGTEESYCVEDTVAVGVQCDSAKCARVMLRCAKIVLSSTCSPHCDILNLQCGDDGCGGTCGSCVDTMCNHDIGRCIQVVGTEWASESSNISKSDLISFGLGCQGHHCSQIQLIQKGLSVDGSVYMESPWISDNIGKRYFWQKGQQADSMAADCPDRTAVTWIECSGKKCDNIRFFCAKPLNWVVNMTGEAVLTDWFSEEQARRDCPARHVLTGMECQKSRALWQGCAFNCGDYCDNKRLRCRPIIAERVGKANLGVLSRAELPVGVSPVEWTVNKTTGNSAFFSISGVRRCAADAALLSLLVVCVWS
eukprot:TRINITY_DN31114_c0_g1_i7.p1 TRINITY_DN31114_c0_g1~~TRINITY_DN31114_c0_g1_i7.p1  ORF type:complete len:1031 (-),score=164.52 TRINITY_DN31114_c0_g1_i7:84-2765(-)